LTATVCKPVGLALRLLATTLGIVCLMAATACSSSSSQSEEPSDGGTDSGPPACGLFCNDAAFDGPLWVQVKGELDEVCGSPDGCHGAGVANFGVHPNAEFSDMINVTSTENPPMKRVVPGDPDNSYVFLKLNCNGGIVDACMPLGNPNPATAKLFHDWIEAGAQTQ
jgi:hypothetical protein